jgi:hypothetical protein
LVSRPEGERSVSSERNMPSAMTKPPSTCNGCKREQAG